MTNAPNNLKRGEKGMKKKNMLIPAVILMATLLSAGCTAGSTQGVTETAVQAERAVEETTCL